MAVQTNISAKYGKDVGFERIRRITGYLVGTMDKWKMCIRDRHNSTGSDGGGVFVGPSAKFTMNAGSITDNTSTRSGGGVANGNSTRVGGTFLMNGGIIGNNAVTGENFNKASGNLFTRIDTITRCV